MSISFLRLAKPPADKFVKYVINAGEIEPQSKQFHQMCQVDFAHTVMLAEQGIIKKEDASYTTKNKNQYLIIKFKIKNPERVLIVSDTVKGTGIEDKRLKQELTDISGRLAGGSMTVPESAKRLIEKGFHEGTIRDCITKNPEQYLYNKAN